MFIKNPQLIWTSLDFKGSLYGFQCVKLAELSDVLVNSLPLLTETAKATAMSNTFA
jgi:hypothetical protein